MNQWIANDQADVPDFVIIGAMKSGTTTLHEMLASHPDVHIPADELFFFSQDDVAEHPNFAKHGADGLLSHLHQSDGPDWSWYRQKLHHTKSKRLVGEDSTTYLCSPRALQRLAAQPKAVKILVVLRHPTERAYSQYWHMVRARRAVYSFEDTLRFMPQQLLSRSQYVQQLREVYTHFDKSQVKVVLFEQFVKQQSEVLAEVCDFLGLDAGLFAPDVYELHKNASQLPRSIALELVTRRLYRGQERTIDSHFSSQRGQKTFFEKVYRALNPLVNKKPPKMAPATKQYLDAYFESQLSGLDELVGKPFMQTWFGK
ncbi:hypothetical protein PALB_11730 [Pseudoalteromonas luteoviolacea B = ATCC 29581]|nr:hypothetical protein PALB_11730 [Pseudoalteromonas luteoviolacea B = ATCC 29581]